MQIKWQMVILYLCVTPCSHLIWKKHCDGTQMATHDAQIMNMKQDRTEVTTCKARIKYVVLLNVLFYKWLGYPAGISGWHCAAVTTTISPTHACLSMEASPQKSNVRCYPSPLIERDPAQHRGLGGPASKLETEKLHYWACFVLEHGGCHDCFIFNWGGL